MPNIVPSSFRPLRSSHRVCKPARAALIVSRGRVQDRRRCRAGDGRIQSSWWAAAPLRGRRTSCCSSIHGRMCWTDARLQARVSPISRALAAGSFQSSRAGPALPKRSVGSQHSYFDVYPPLCVCVCADGRRARNLIAQSLSRTGGLPVGD